MAIVRIQYRRDTTANWEFYNPVLARGEPGYDWELKISKLGDGVTPWLELPVSGSGGSGGGAVDSVNGETGTVVIDAADIDIADVAGYYTATNVEAALAEVKLVADTAAGGITLEQVQDDLGNTSLIAGTSLTKTYNDGAGTITLDVDAADFATAGHNHAGTYQPLDSDLTTIAAANNGSVLAATTASFTTAADSKLAGIEAGADVTDATNVAAAGAVMDSDIGTTVQAYDADTLKADTPDTLTAGFDSSDYAAGTKSSGTYTPDPANGNFQVATNGGAHTLAPPATSCSIVIHYTNNGSAGAITTSGFTQVTGDAFTTTNGHEFVCVVTKINDVSVLNVTALQ